MPPTGSRSKQTVANLKAKRKRVSGLGRGPQPNEITTAKTAFKVLSRSLSGEQRRAVREIREKGLTPQDLQGLIAAGLMILNNARNEDEMEMDHYLKHFTRLCDVARKTIQIDTVAKMGGGIHNNVIVNQVVVGGLGSDDGPGDVITIGAD